jgi:membrane associated rhomboid family serine protease
VLPLKDLNVTRLRPLVTLALIAVNVGVWLFYQLPDGVEASAQSLGFHPCEIDASCPQVGRDWPITIFTSMFLHADWLHLGGNMLFLWVFGNNVEDAMGHARFLFFYVAGGLAAAFSQALVTLAFGNAGEGAIPNVGASGAIAAVLGAYLVLFPRAMVLTWIFPIFLFPVPALLFLVLWFGLQLISGTASMTTPEAGGGIAYFAHIGGFAFGLLTVKLFTAGRPRPGSLRRFGTA